MIATIDPDIAASAFLRGTLWAVVFYYALRHRDALTITVVLLAWAVGGLLATGHIAEAGIAAVPQVALIAWLLIDRLYQRPEHMQHIAAVQVSDARREVHDAVNDARAWEARYRAAERKLQDHGLRP